MYEFLRDYTRVINSMLADIWKHMVWKPKKNPGKKQERILPTIPDYSFKKGMRNAYLQGWTYSRHWIDSALKTAFSIINSWKKNYVNGRRTRTQPVVKRLFARVKQTQLKLIGDTLRISPRPREFVYTDLPRRYFKLERILGEPIITTTHIHLPLRQYHPAPENKVKIGWDANKCSLDGFSPQLGWIKVELKPLPTLHTTYDHKKRRINRFASKKKRVGKRIRQKYRHRERNRVDQLLHLLTTTLANLGEHMVLKS